MGGVGGDGSGAGWMWAHFVVGGQAGFLGGGGGGGGGKLREICAGALGGAEIFEFVVERVGEVGGVWRMGLVGEDEGNECGDRFPEARSGRAVGGDHLRACDSLRCGVMLSFL